MKYNTITRQAAAKVPAGIYEGIDYHGSPPADVAARAGWGDVTPEIQAVIDQQAAQVKAEQDAKDAETKALEDAQKAALDKAKAGIDGKIEDRVANIETILGLRKATTPK